MPWLVVLGEGSWSPLRGVRFKPGKHEVTEEIAAIVRTQARRNLLVFDIEPEIVSGAVAGPLTADDIKLGRTSSPRLPEQEMAAELEEEYDIPLTHPCHWCTSDTRFPSAAALARHQKVNHPEMAGR